MFSHVGWGEIAVLAVVGLFVFGPERLPKVAAEAARMLRRARQALNDATGDLKAELGPEMADVDLASLHPRTFVRKHLFEDDDEVGVTPSAPPAQRSGGPPLSPGERPPYDADAT